ncbi:unnamed protein product [Adineta steineri]|uniref:Uncharacterized protein n=1 Tax=Adineta steineri TaxID=433720 RepID=A0A814GUM6_9BILA|nr:unnamed protein product [Adineta steineri]CAF1303578.1 unnamed protein product [Adineta steineri]CAF1304640.1 unnamed protein product [Adineta steineri]
MIIINDSLLLTSTTTSHSDLNSTNEIYDTSSSSTIITIIILSCLSISGWIFMSYALFSRSEAYRRKPDDQYGVSHYVDNPERSIYSDFITDFD